MGRHCLALPPDTQPKPYARLVHKTLRSGQVGAREVADVGEPQIPPSVQIRRLSVAPHVFDVGTNERFDVDAHA